MNGREGLLPSGLSILPVVLIGLGILICTGACAQESSAQESSEREVTTEVLDEIDESGEARVVVSLQKPPSLQVKDLGSSTADGMVEALQENALSSISSSGFRLIHRYESIPAIVGIVTSRSVLPSMVSSSSVRSVDLDPKIEANLGGSVEAIEADRWHNREVKGSSSTVAVLDTGIDTDHPDLSDDLIDQACFLLSETCSSNDAAEDDNGHGTEVAGIISSGGAEAPRGVAPNADIVALKILNSQGSGFLSNAVSALDYLINNPGLGAGVVSMSFSTSRRETPCNNSSSATESMADALSSLRSDGVVAFGASGNDGTLSGMGAPACISNVVSVGATDRSDDLTFFSNTDSNLDLLAPGSGIETSGIGGGTTSFTGTSASAPHAAGCAALLEDSGRYESASEIEKALEVSPTEVGDARGRQFPKLNCFTNEPDDGPPPAVSDVTLEDSEPENTTFEWRTSSEKVAEYHVYRSTKQLSSPSSEVPYDTVFGGTTTYTDTTVGEGEAYYYQVEAVDAWGNGSELSSAATVDFKPPPAVSKIFSAASGPGDVNVGWERSPAEDVALHKIYRDTARFSSASSEILIDSPPAGQTQYRDTTASEGEIYYYQVAAVDTAGNASSLSSSGIQVDLEPPPVINEISLGNSDPRDVSIGWKESPAEDVALHKIYRDTSQFSSISSEVLIDSLPAGQTQYQDTTASEGKIYYYQVAAVDTAGNTSGLSSGGTRVDLKPPAAVSKVSSGSSAPGDISIGWERSPAEDVALHKVYRDTSQFSSASSEALIDSIPAGQTQYRDTTASEAVYYYRVAAVDTAGNASNLSSAVQVDLEPPPGVANLSVRDAEPENVSLGWERPETKDLAKHVIYRDRKPLSLAEASPLDTLSSERTRYQDTTATEGLTFYYRVTAVDTIGNESTSRSEVSAFLYPEEVQTEAAMDFEDGGATSSDYRLVALPGRVDRSLSSTTEGKSGTNWQAYWDDGSDTDYLLKYDGSSTFDFTPGRGIWLTHREEWRVEETIPTVQLRGDSATSIDLHQGWNIISNPLEKNVPWSTVAAANGDSLRALWRFKGSFARSDTFRSAKTGEAFYFLNDTGLDSLSIPYPGAPVSPQKSRPENSGSLIAITAQPEAENSPESTVRVGFDEAASENLGPLDRPAPPGRFSNVSLRLKVPGKNTRRNTAMTEWRPPIKEDEGGKTFQLQLRAEGDGATEVFAEIPDNMGPVEARLLRPSTGESYDLSEGEPITVEEADTTSLELAVGSPSYIESQEERILPEEVTLALYPNPVQRQATVEYTLLEEKEVRLAVYDVLGRRVAVLEEGRRDAGRHSLKLDAGRLSSGVYFGRMQVGDQTLTQKITVVR